MNNNGNEFGNLEMECLVALTKTILSDFRTNWEIIKESLVKIDKFDGFTIDTVVIDLCDKYYESAIMHSEFEYGMPIILGKCSIKDNPLDMQKKFVEQYKNDNYVTITDYDGKVFKRGEHSKSSGIVTAMKMEDLKRRGQL